MKFIAKLAVGCVSILAVSSVKLKKGDLDQSVTVKNNFKDKWSNLFDNATDKPLGCEDSFKTTDPLDEKEASEASGRLPIAKTNKWSQNGKGKEAYLFDYIDGAFKNKVVSLFDTTFKQASAISKANIEDPYALESLLFAFSQGKAGNIEKDANGNFIGKDTASGLSKYIPGFNEADWKSYVTIPQLQNIIDTWGWEKPKRDILTLLNKYDFDGDGRLNPNEFLLLSIKNNAKILGTSQCQTNCYASFINDVIDPYFAYVDCDSDGFIGAEELWESLRHLKREGKGYNIFNCKINGNGLPRDVRTDSINDFVLKNSKIKNGKLNLQEFRSAILTGFVNRQVTNKNILTEVVSDIAQRWSNNGEIDIRCDDIAKIASDKGKNMAPKVAA